MKTLLLNTFNLNRKLVSLLLLATISVGLIDLLIVSCFIPYLNYLGGQDFDSVFNLGVLGRIDSTNFQYKSIELLLILGVLNCFGIVLTYLINKHSILIGFQLSTDLLKKLFSVDLLELKDQSQDAIFSKIYNESSRYANGVIGMLFQITARAISTILIIGYLFSINSELTLFALLFFILIYLVIIRNVSPILNTNSKKISTYLERRKYSIDNAINGFQQILIYNQQKSIVSDFHNINKKYSYALSLGQTLSTAPKYVIELALFFLIIGFAIYSNRTESIENFGALIFSFGGASLKLIPSINATYVSFSKIKIYYNSYTILKGDIEEAIQNKREGIVGEKHKEMLLEPSQDRFDIVVRDLNFSYPNGQPIFDHLNLTFIPGNWYCIQGKSGVGKSTLFNIMLGFIEKTKANISYGGKSLQEIDIDQLYQKIGYITQDNYILNDTVRNNIGFGQTLADDKYQQLLKDFNIDFSDKAFLNNQLSGGQRQKINLARALARDPKILFLDEAFSSLDHASKSKVVNSIKRYFDQTPQMIIIEITHEFSHDFFTQSVELKTNEP